MKKKTATLNGYTPWAYVIAALIVGLLVGKYVYMPSTSEVVDNSTVSSDIYDLVTYVDSAAVMVEEQGESAFTELREESGNWWNGEQYVFAYDMNGNTLVLPPTPEAEGTNRLSLTDSDGVRFVNEMVLALKNKDTAWVQYSYPKPGDTIGSPKLAYVRKIKLPSGKSIFVGSGVYY